MIFTVTQRVMMLFAILLPCWKKQMRQHDLICRWGGEEFIIAALDLNPPDALLLGERMRATGRVNAG